MCCSYRPRQGPVEAPVSARCRCGSRSPRPGLGRSHRASRRMRSRWVFTVWGRSSSVATWRVVDPSATFCRISRSRLDSGAARALGLTQPHLLDERLRELGMDHRVPLDRVLGRVDEARVGRHPSRVAGNTRLDRLADRAARLVDRDQDDLGCRSGLTDAPRRLDAVHAGHAHVHEDDVGVSSQACSTASSPVAASPTTTTISSESSSAVRSPSRVTGWRRPRSAAGSATPTWAVTRSFVVGKYGYAVQDRTSQDRMRACTKRSRLTQEATEPTRRTPWDGERRHARGRLRSPEERLRS